MSIRVTPWVAVWLVLGGAACGGKPISAPKADAGATGAAGIGAAGDLGTAGTGAAGTGMKVVADPGFVGPRLLSRREYRNTARDLLGVEADEDLPYEYRSDEFDNGASYGFASGDLYRAYLEEAQRISEVVFATPALRTRVVACPTPEASAGACVRAIVPTLAQRAWRRPLSDEEALRLATLADEAASEGASRDRAIQRALAALLSATPFLYKLEVDPDPTSTAPHAVTAWELAARLSYTLWGTMPDDRLFALAADGTLARDEVLSAQVDRLLDDPRADAIIDGFAQPWILGPNAFQGHQVEPRFAPGWKEELATAMSEEFRLYAREFLRGDRSFATFPSADFNFVNAALARHYGMSEAGLGDQLTRVEVATDRRRGLLGLGSFLLTSSLSHRTSIPIRGTIVLSRFLCVDIAPPPPEVPKLDTGEATDPALPIPTPREYFLSLEQQAGCGSCHRSFDAYGFALEDMDLVGKFRATYPDGRPVDPRGTLPDGTSFTGEAELADTLARDPRFIACAARKAFTYASGRPLKPADDPTLAKIGADWAREGTKLRALFRRIALDDTFRYRRGGAP